MIKLFRHKESKRYLVGFTRDKQAETTKYIPDAIKFDFSKRYRQANFHMFIVNHRDELKEFEVIDQ